MKSLRNDVHKLFGNMQVRIKIYQDFYHGIYIANQGRHIKMLDLPRSDKAKVKSKWGNLIYLDWVNAQIYALTRCTMTVHVTWSCQLSEMWYRYYMATENDISHNETKPAAIKWGLQRQATELIGHINSKMTDPVDSS